jgi:hypothetical protein
MEIPLLRRPQFVMLVWRLLGDASQQNTAGQKQAMGEEEDG